MSTSKPTRSVGRHLPGVRLKPLEAHEWGTLTVIRVAKGPTLRGRGDIGYIVADESGFQRYVSFATVDGSYVVESSQSKGSTHVE